MTIQVFNLRELALDSDPRLEVEGHRARRKSLSSVVGSRLTGFSVYELEPGQKAWAYHWEMTREEWLFVVEGEIVVRTPDGEETLRRGDVTCFPAGPSGAHEVRNDSDAPARYCMPSSSSGVVVAVRPDSNTMLVAGEGLSQIVPLDVSLDYWDREP